MIHTYDEENIIKTRDLRALIGYLVAFDLDEFVEEFLEYWGVSRMLALSIMYVGMLGWLALLIPNLPLFAFEWLVGTAPFWMPVGAVIVAWNNWLWYARGNFLFKREPILLELKMPREITRSPRAMDNALSKLWIDSGVTTFLHRVWGGGVMPIFSLEIASFGGSVHFYIWCWKPWRPNVESAIYAYYPEIEIVEAEDYASKFKYDPTKIEAFPTDWRFEPNNDAYPIKTYVDFELDEDPKEEYRIDPLAEVLERMSNLRPDEQMWIQIIITLCKDRMHKAGDPWWKTRDRYVTTLSDEIDNIRKKEAGTSGPEDQWRRGVRIPQARQIDLVKAIDRNLSKHPFNVGSRGVYISDANKFSSPGYTALRWIWRPMGNPQFANQMRPRRWGNPFDWPWQDLWDIRWRLMCRRFFDAYRRRSHFYEPWKLPYNMMSTETIATLWHPPSSAVAAPGLQRISAKKAEPPPNLPM